MTAAEVPKEAAPQEVRPTKQIPAETVEALAQALENAQTAGEPVDALAEASANGDSIKAEIIGDKVTGRVLVITAGSMSTETTAQPESDVPAKKSAPKGNGNI